MENIFLIIFLLSPFLLLAGLIKPSLISKIIKRNVTRKAIVLGGILTIIGSLVGIGITADPPKENKEVFLSSVYNETVKTETEVSSLSIDTNNVINAKVSRVIDGDTIEVSIDSKTEKVRIIGIDSPETVDPRNSVECFGILSSNKAREALKIGGDIYLESDPSQDNKDKYSRLLRYVWINEKTDFGRYMIEEGYAYEYTYEKPYKYQSIYKQSQKDAEVGKKGLWADGVCVITPTAKPTAYPTNTKVLYVAPTSTPYVAPIIPLSNISPSSDSLWTCDCSLTCPNISSCDEAYFQLNTCGCSIRDRDKDGVPCEDICPGG
ncbi:MAG: Micrococcal nuclease [Candidatus Woesebacteria bacterium GW2011_GWC1_38_13]|uniref:Micrococcal nuclease n=3 Tax=Candidatus Woeseibacteriota TaxID=1752722 RepID=A0A0G0KTJ6_9BACT|nr:MAG: Micrococcal nuclease [Candidatus Woesebacteria bacterium GW2011_GWD1_38_10]KKQ55872.1 MAG: Micrococcal nuclease [Candidatus Woesebacteria bacterium GW2011_GWC1_38_13]KKQ83003.1 MAG: Micrococcal nuclease [Candidatus Woesebacteria bacterium GW2011_GWA1_38_8]